MFPIHAKAVALIQHYESLHDGDLNQVGLQPKPCPAGIWTGGWGRALRHPQTGRFLTLKGGKADQDMAYRLCEGLDEAKANTWLAEDLTDFVRQVDALVKVPLTGGQRGALVSFAYNVGTKALADSTLLRKLNAKDYQGAANEFPRWNKSGGKVLRGLILRREAERDLFVRGQD